VWSVVIVRLAAALGGRTEVRRGPCAPVNSKAEGAHFQAARTAAFHALPPSCNYSRCRSSSHIPTNRARAPRGAPVCCNNCARRPSQSAASPQRRPARRPASNITAGGPRRITGGFTAGTYATGTISGPRPRNNALRRPDDALLTTTCKHHRRDPRSWERRDRVPALHTLRHWRFWPPSWRLSSPLPWLSPEGSWARPRATPTRKT
jgi:hypothetical protein